MKSNHPSAVQIIRHIVQLVAFLLFPELFITVLQALGDVVTALANGTFSADGLSAQLITIAAVFFITAVWGRSFCGYLCSFGALQELFFHGFKKRFPQKTGLPARLDGALQYPKYLVFAFLAVGVWIMGLPMEASFRPWGIFGMLISGNASVMAAAVRTAGFVLLLVFLIASLFVERFFCRYICPLGALFTIISGKRWYKIRRNESSCTKCGLCEKTCGMGVWILKKEAVDSGNCINCMACVTRCPQKCLSANPGPAVAGTAAAVAMCGLVQLGTLTVPENAAALETYCFDETKKGTYIDGVYTGVGAGFRGDTEVQVTVENGYITDITVLSYEDDAEFFQKAQCSILSQIISEQSVEVENVSGATFSCNGLIDAVANALGMERQAGAADAAQPGGQEEEPYFNQSTDSEPELSSVADGTYDGEGNGFRGTTRVSVTVEGGKITDITVVSCEDDESFFVRAEDAIISEIIDGQSLDVSCVSGATFSSNGLLEAVANALNLEFDNPNQYSSHKGGHEKGEFEKRRH